MHTISEKEVLNCKKKKRFKTKNKARYVLSKFMFHCKDENRNVPPLSIYHCPVCHNYHFTSSTKERQQFFKNLYK